MQTSNAVQKLMNAGRDCERMLRHESEFVQGQPRIVLRRVADECHAKADQLQGAAASRGGRLPVALESWAELARELTRSMRVAAGGTNRGDAVSACRRALGRLEEVYQDAVELCWPEETHRLLTGHLAGIRRDAQELIGVQY